VSTSGCREGYLEEYGICVCDQNYYVVTNECMPCPAGTENDVGDVANGVDTHCDIIPVDCEASWSTCNQDCEKTYTITTQSVGRDPCEASHGDIMACAPGVGDCPPPPVDCEGSWTGGGPQTYQVSIEASNGGASCEAAHGDTRVCRDNNDIYFAWLWGSFNCEDLANNVEADARNLLCSMSEIGNACPVTCNVCTPPVDCVGSWSVCQSNWPHDCTQRWTMGTPASNGGHCEASDGDTRPCSAGTDNCPQACVQGSRDHQLGENCEPSSRRRSSCGGTCNNCYSDNGYICKRNTHRQDRCKIKGGSHNINNICMLPGIEGVTQNVR
jgi:hypothetical protein